MTPEYVSPRDMAATLLLPVLSGVALYGWIEWHPWGQNPCAAPAWIAVTWVLFLVLPPVFTGLRLRRAGQGRTIMVALLTVSLFVAALSCFVAFGLSFSDLHCGD